LDSFKGLANEGEVVDLLCQLIAINSVNSALQGGVGEAAVGEFVARYLSGLGCEVEQKEGLAGHCNVFGRFTTLPAGRKALLFEAHMDTVPLEPMPDALNPRVIDGRVYGRGACDTKGSLAAMLYAFKLLSQQLDTLSCNPIMMAAVDEEVAQQGIRTYAKTRPKLDGAVVGEPTNLVAAIVHKGCVRWRVRAVGKAAHTSRPHEGNNAIYQMVEFINQLRAQIESQLPAKAHPMAGAPTLTVGVIHGGIQVNIVPDSCWIEIDRRTVPGEQAEIVLKEVDELIRRMEKDNPEFHFVREEPSVVSEYLDTPPGREIAQSALAACRTVLGQGELGAVAYGSDASKISAIAGVPAVVLGPGSINQAHTADEWVLIDEVVRCAEVYAEICRVFGRS
jgi:acetylornithine deacetylase/succinyl-diaminopimelate desuccinylase-like protein